MDECVQRYDSLPQDLSSHFEIPSSIMATAVVGTQSFYDILFLSDAQIVKYTGANIQQLNIPLCRRVDEQGGVIEGTYVSMADLPDMSFGEFFSLRRIGIFSTNASNPKLASGKWPKLLGGSKT